MKNTNINITSIADLRLAQQELSEQLQQLDEDLEADDTNTLSLVRSFCNLGDQYCKMVFKLKTLMLEQGH